MRSDIAMFIGNRSGRAGEREQRKTEREWYFFFFFFFFLGGGGGDKFRKKKKRNFSHKNRPIFILINQKIIDINK